MMGRETTDSGGALLTVPEPQKCLGVGGGQVLVQVMEAEELILAFLNLSATSEICPEQPCCYF